MYSCKKITKTWIQISCQDWFGLLLGTIVLSFKKLWPHCAIDMTLLKMSLKLRISSKYISRVTKYELDPLQRTVLAKNVLYQLKVLNYTILILNESLWSQNHLESVCYHSEPTEVTSSKNKKVAEHCFCKHSILQWF